MPLELEHRVKTPLRSVNVRRDLSCTVTEGANAAIELQPPTTRVVRLVATTTIANEEALIKVQKDLYAFLFFLQLRRSIGRRLRYTVKLL